MGKPLEMEALKFTQTEIAPDEAPVATETPETTTEPEVIPGEGVAASVDAVGDDEEGEN
jgi:hypothetical protein